MQSRRHFVLGPLAGLACLTWAGSAATVAQPARPPTAAALTMGVAIDRSGRQRMLSQRMAKAYVQILNRTIPERSQSILRDSINFFENSLSLLLAFAPDSDSKSALESQRALWSRYRAELDKTPSAASLSQVMTLSDEVLKTGEAATAALSKVSGTTSGRIVNISGRQRMLSQRIAKFYGYGLAIKSPQNFSRDIEEASKQFVQAMQELEGFPQNTDSIKSTLTIVRSQWAFYEQGFRTTGSPEIVRSAAENVAKASENILQSMDIVTEAYARIVG